MNERKIGRNERKIGRREFLRFSALAAAGLAAAACSTGGPEGAAQEGVPPSSRPKSAGEPTSTPKSIEPTKPTNTPEPNFTPRPTETLQGIVSESTGRPTQEVTEVTVFLTPTPVVQKTKETIPPLSSDSHSGFPNKPVLTEDRTPGNNEIGVVEHLPPRMPVDNLFTLSVSCDAQDHSLSCEATAAAMVASYFGLELPEGQENWEEFFIKAIPPDCNPNKGFRGSVDGKLSTSCNSEANLGYGVYAEPLARALQNAHISAQVEYGIDYDAVEKAIRAGNLVIVWISWKKEPVQSETDPETGETYPLILGEHVLLVIGARGKGSQREFLVNDPFGGKQYWLKGFPRWEDFKGMRIVTTKEKGNLVRNGKILSK